MKRKSPLILSAAIGTIVISLIAILARLPFGQVDTSYLTAIWYTDMAASLINISAGIQLIRGTASWIKYAIWLQVITYVAVNVVVNIEDKTFDVIGLIISAVIPAVIVILLIAGKSENKR